MEPQVEPLQPPPEMLQVTAVLAAFETVAENCWVPLGNRVTLLGNTLTLIGCGAVMVIAAEAFLVVS